MEVILGKAEVYAQDKKIDPEALLRARLYPDMYPLTRQVQLACDFAKGAGARLAGVEVPSHADTETTFPELKARIAKVLAFLEQLPAEAFEGSEGRTITLKVGPQEMTFSVPITFLASPCEFLFPLHDGLRSVAAQRPRSRQAGFHEPRQGLRWPFPA